MRKLAIFLCPIISSFAVDQTSFQQFENEYNLGFSYSHGNLINGNYDTSSFNQENLNLEIEHLFDNGIWLDGNLDTVLNYNQPNLGYLNGGNGSGTPFGDQPFMGGINVKLGYAFQLVNNHLQLIPYGSFGINNNWSASTVYSNGGNNLSTDYYLAAALGARLAYRINNTIMLYADQNINYNWDQSGAIKDIQTGVSFYGKTYAATNYTFNSIIGAKFNVYKALQLGINAFWQNYQHQSNISGVVYLPQNSFGTMLTLGLTY